MKTFLVTIALMASAQSFAKFNPENKLEEGRLHYQKALEISEKNKEKIVLIGEGLSDKARELSTISPLEVTEGCSELLLKNSSDLSAKLTRAVQKELDNKNKSLAELESNVERYISAEQCSACDAEIRQETLKKYAERISHNVIDLSRINEIDTAEDIKMVSDRTLCDFDKYFSFKDTEKFKKYKRWGFASYGSNLSVEEILSGNYEKTLEYIIRKAPIKVERDASRIGKAKSSYKNGVVKITISYDYSVITGPDNVSHPEGNPIEIIKSTLK